MNQPTSDSEEPEQAPLEDEEPVDEHIWEPVGDLEQADLPDPLADAEEEPSDEPWAAVSDLDAEDAVLIDPEEDAEQAPDPWGSLEGLPDPLDSLPTPAPPVVVAQALLMPPMHEWREERQELRRLPWRTTATVCRPDLGELVCVADPSAATSQLLVAAWEWRDPEERSELVFRVADDGPECSAPATGIGEVAVQCELELDGETVEAFLELVSAREERGLRLGRDLLGRRFLVDPSDDELEAD
jgi:hypothetical protein